MNGKEIAAFARAERGAARFMLLRDNGQQASAVCRSREGEKPGELGKRFWERASSYVDETSLGGKFVVVAHDEGGKVLDSLPIVLEGNELERPTTLSQQPLTADFALRHSLKNAEARDVSSRKLMAELHAEYRRDLQSKARRIQDLEAKFDEALKERVRTVEVIESLKSQAHSRKLAQIESEATARQQGWIFEKVVEHMPIIVGALTGSTKAHKFVNSLKAEEQALLKQAMASLSTEQVGLFNELLALGEKADKAVKRLTVAPKKEPSVAVG